MVERDLATEESVPLPTGSLLPACSDVSYFVAPALSCSPLPSTHPICVLALSLRRANLCPVANLPPPPPSPYSTQPMPPPSSPPSSQPQFNVNQLAYNANNAASRPIPLPPYSTSKEAPAPPSASRPGSSMSISAMLDSGEGKPSRDLMRPGYPNGLSSAVNSTMTSPLTHTALALSPPKSHRHHGSLNHELSNNGHGHGSVHQPSLGTRSFRSYSGGQTPSSVNNEEFSSGNLRFSAPTQSYSPRARGSSDSKRRHDKAASMGIATEVPSARANGSEPPLFMPDLSSRPRSQGLSSDIQGPSRMPDHPAFPSSQNVESSPQSSLNRFRTALVDVPQPRLADTHPKRTDSQGGLLSPRHNRNASKNHTTSNHAVTDLDILNRRSVQGLGLGRPHELMSLPPTDSRESPFSPEILRRMREERLASASGQQPNPLSLANDIRPGPAERYEPPGPQQHPVFGPPIPAEVRQNLTADALEQAGRNVEDPYQHQRSPLQMFLKENKRGRQSPLPQAVQGAQSEARGPASDPGIKNAFTRVFGGIGGGAVMTGSGNTTPFPPSPTGTHDSERRTPFSNRNDPTELSKPRGGARARQTKRKIKDESVNDGENASLLGNGTIGRGGQRRSRVPHHHHPHSHNHR